MCNSAIDVISNNSYYFSCCWLSGTSISSKIGRLTTFQPRRRMHHPFSTKTTDSGVFERYLTVYGSQIMLQSTATRVSYVHVALLAHASLPTSIGGSKRLHSTAYCDELLQVRRNFHKRTKRPANALSFAASCYFSCL